EPTPASVFILPIILSSFRASGDKTTRLCDIEGFATLLDTRRERQFAKTYSQAIDFIRSKKRSPAISSQIVTKPGGGRRFAKKITPHSRSQNRPACCLQSTYHRNQ